MTRQWAAGFALGSGCCAFVLSLGGLAAAHEGHGHSSPNITQSPPRFSAPSAPRPSPPRNSPLERLPATPPSVNTATDPPIPAQQPIASQPRGQVKATWRHLFEVRYAPWGIQIFVSDASGNPLSPRGIQGDVVLEVRGDPRQWRYPLQYVAADASPVGREHLLVLADLSRVRDGDMLVLVDMTHLPQPEESSVRFVQTFAVTSPAEAARPLTVTVVEFTESDRTAVARQRTCPVTNDDFKHGPPIKLLVGNQVLYVCCEPCIEEVRQAPEKFFNLAAHVPPAADPLAAQQAPPPGVPATAPPAGGVAVLPVTIADRESMVRQQICPVTNQPLGAHGVPLRVTAHGQYVYVCCAACVPNAERLLSQPPIPPAQNCRVTACSSCRAK